MEQLGKLARDGQQAGIVSVDKKPFLGINITFI